MQRITPTDIKTLSKHKSGPAVSVYMPTAGADFADNREYLKHLLSAARTELTQFATYKEKHEALYPAFRLLHDREWWRFTDRGVAIFSKPDGLWAYHLSSEPKEELVVSNRFHILPLLEHLNHRASFYILAISPKNARLMHCDGEDVLELSVPNMPHTIDDVAIHSEHLTPSRDGHNKPPLRKALSALREGGKRAIKRQHQDVLETEYLQQINKAVHSLLASKQEPVVLAGLRRTQGLYKKVNSLATLQTEAVTANPDRLSNIELRNRAMLLLGEYFTEKELAAQSHFLRMSVARPERIVYGVKNVMQLIYQGKVQTLFVDKTARQWGVIKRTIVEMHGNKHSGDSNLVDVAASEALKRRGTVFTLEPSDLPQGSKMAAILRY